MPINDCKLQVFLCHASQDKPIVCELYQRFILEGWIAPWLDEEKLIPCIHWGLQIEKAVESTDAVIICISNHSVTKEGYVQKEMKVSLDYSLYKPEGMIFIIPLRLDACSIPWSIKSIQHIDYFPLDQVASAYKRLIYSLETRANLLGLDIIEIKKYFQKEAEEKTQKEIVERINKETREKIRREEENVLRQEAEENARVEIMEEVRKLVKEGKRKEADEKEKLEKELIQKKADELFKREVELLKQKRAKEETYLTRGINESYIPEHTAKKNNSGLIIGIVTYFYSLLYLFTYNLALVQRRPTFGAVPVILDSLGVTVTAVMAV